MCVCVCVHAYVCVCVRVRVRVFLWVGGVFRLGLGLWCWGEGVAVSGRVRGCFRGIWGPREKGFCPGVRTTNRALLNSSGLNTLAPK